MDVNRIIDTAPHARNESMASFLRMARICEERGSGFDRMEEGMIDLKIPAPKVETGDDFTRTKLYWYPSLKDFDRINSSSYRRNPAPDIEDMPAWKTPDI